MVFFDKIGPITKYQPFFNHASGVSCRPLSVFDQGQNNRRRFYSAAGSDIFSRLTISLLTAET